MDYRSWMKRSRTGSEVFSQITAEAAIDPSVLLVHKVAPKECAVLDP